MDLRKLWPGWSRRRNRGWLRSTKEWRNRQTTAYRIWPIQESSSEDSADWVHPFRGSLWPSEWSAPETTTTIRLYLNSVHPMVTCILCIDIQLYSSLYHHSAYLRAEKLPASHYNIGALLNVKPLFPVLNVPVPVLIFWSMGSTIHRLQASAYKELLSNKTSQALNHLPSMTTV